jgi:hypothetical protein
VLSVKQCRHILGLNAPASDRDVERLRDEIYALAQIALASPFLQPNRRENHGNRAANHYAEAIAWFSADERVEIEERAGIMEYDGHLPRDEAERCAIASIAERRRTTDGTPPR